jgi:hypothetical protein
MEIYLEVRRGVKPWERALQNDLWLAGTQCEAKILRISRCITESRRNRCQKSKTEKISGGETETSVLIRSRVMKLFSPVPCFY